MKNPKINREGTLEFENSVTVGIPRVVKSGNPNYDTSTGRFASGTNEQKMPISNLGVLRQSQEVHIDPAAKARRDDVVRFVSRNMPQPTITQVRDYLRNKTKRELDDHEILNIIVEAEQMRSNDVVDVIDGLIKKQGWRSVFGKNGVAIKATRGWLKSQLASLTDAQIYDVYRRLISRGNSEEQIYKGFIKRFGKQKAAQIEKMLGVYAEPNGQPSKAV